MSHNQADKTTGATGDRIVWDLATDSETLGRGAGPWTQLARLAAATALAVFGGGGAAAAHATIPTPGRSLDPVTFNGAEPAASPDLILTQSTTTTHCSPHHDVHADKTMHVNGGAGSDNLGNDVHIDTHQDAAGSCD